MSDDATPKRLLLLTTTTGYQTHAFVEAARSLGLDVVFGTDRCHVLDDPWQDGALPLRFEDAEGSAQGIIEYARSNPVHAVVALGDRPTATAARVCQTLRLPHHPPEATETCRDKYLSRERLRAAGLEVPRFARFPLTADPRTILCTGAPALPFPCVLKPLSLSASRGVIRADDPRQLVDAFERIKALLLRPDVQVLREAAAKFIQVEEYVEGLEIAIEGLVDRGRLQVLAAFDKPDRLVGPFFEETIYVTPSRLAPQAQAAVRQALERAVKALGLYHGPLHAEMRLGFGVSADSHTRTERSRGASGRVSPIPKHIWIMEVAARSIGGLCSRALRFCSPERDEPISLEELIIRLALGENVARIERESNAAGVMMIPIPEAGVYQDVEGVEQARETPGVEDIVITAKPTQKIEPLPEGSSYLGFIFARGPSPEFVERALRAAHRKLNFLIASALPVIH